MNDEQLQEWLAQHGGEVGRKDNEKDAEDGTLSPNTGAPNKKRIVDSTTITARDGATLTIRRDTSGSGPTYSVIENTPAKPSASGQPARTPEQTVIEQANADKAKREQAEREKNAALPADQDPRYETDKEREDRANARIKQQGADAEAARQRQRQDEADARAATDRNRPQVRVEEDGKGGVVAISTFPDGRIETKPVPGISGKPVEITHEGRRYRLNQASGKYDDVTPETPDDKPLPAGVPAFQPNYDEDDLGLTAYNDALMEANRMGLISRAQAKGLIEQAGALAERTASHGTQTRTLAQGTRGQDITQRQQSLSEIASRRTAANQLYSQTFGDMERGNELLGEGGGSVATEAFLSALRLGQANVRRWGGLEEVPEVPAAYVNAVKPASSPSVHVDPTGGVTVQTGQPSAVPAAANPPSGDTQVANPSAPAQPAAAGTSVAAPAAVPPPTTTLPPQAQGPYPSVNPVTGEPTGLTAPAGAAPSEPMPADGRDWVYVKHNTMGHRQWGLRANVEANPNVFTVEYDPKAAAPAPAAPPPSAAPEDVPIWEPKPRTLPASQPSGAKPAADPNIRAEPTEHPGGGVLPLSPSGVPGGGNVQFMPDGPIPDYLQAARRAPIVFTPDIAALKAKGFTEEEIQEALADDTVA